MTQPDDPVLALVRDLLFASRITTTASGLGIAVRIVRDPQAVGERPARLLLVDLNLDGAIAAAARWHQLHGGRVVGFVSHTDSATIQSAREAGIQHILARSALVQSLPALLVDARSVRQRADDPQQHPPGLR